MSHLIFSLSKHPREFHPQILKVSTSSVSLLPCAYTRPQKTLVFKEERNGYSSTQSKWPQTEVLGKGSVTPKTLLFVSCYSLNSAASKA